MDKNIGKLLDGRYEITELIGIGGMADVYKAKDIVDKKVVAVKILKNEYADNDDFVRRFRNESKAIAVLSHPNIVKIYDVGFTEKMQFIVMEYIDGITLKEFIEQQGSLKWKDAVYFIIQILRALQHAHDRGIVHRDIKPQNIMLFPDGTIKVMDFGIARFAREEGKTMTDKAIGSVHYISPEQAKGDVTDERSDIYSVGIMLYEMLTGIKPFDGESPVSIALMHMRDNARRPRSINDTIPVGLEEIVMRAMQKQPAKRYQSASEMIKDIEEFRRDPSVTFGYALESTLKADAEKTQYFDSQKIVDRVKPTPESSPAPEPARVRTAQRIREPEPDDDRYRRRYDDDYDDDDEEVSKSSYFVVTLTAIAAAVVIIVVIFIVIKLPAIIPTDPVDVDNMPNLIGVNYQDAKTTYSEYFNMTVESQEFSSEYDAGVIISQTPKAGAEFIVRNTEVKVKVSKGPRMVVIKNTYDLDSDTARAMLKDQGFAVSILFEVSDTVEKGNVISTQPAHDESIEYGSTVIMVVSQGPEIQDVIMPDVTGMMADDAKKLLTAKGLTVTIEKQDSLLDKDIVLTQSIDPFDEKGDPTIIPAKTEVKLTVSSGIPPATDENITFAIPAGIEGSAVFTGYINGNIAGVQSIDNLAYVSTVTLKVTGTQIQTVNIEATNTDTGKSGKIGEYVVDFKEGTVTEMNMNKERFEELFTPETETETEESEEEETEDDDEELTIEDPFEIEEIITEPVHEPEPEPVTGDVDSSDDEGWWEEITAGN
ncbi:MAG: Stk1 family PASTA domain-containing Ser/Thr kinase [Oscillospiraceae bacterium]|nr:Stk1 family PASTA domain-containing Ser/Thr kinase [Oscillospiraceae bacterium]MCR5167632.1 Stk1 family PASTA domain-containing Ser/Thr kinase [Oscillospiraceae bacterium]